MAQRGRADVRVLTVVGHPHSGTTWLCRMLAEIVDGSTPVGGPGRKGDGYWRIQRTHGEPRSEPVVLIARDPRDVLGSLRKRHPRRPVDKLVHGPALIERVRPMASAETRYEVLRADGVAEIQRLAKVLFGQDIDEAEAMQCLTVWQPAREPRPVGAWRDDLGSALAREVEARIGDVMQEMGYALDG